MTAKTEKLEAIAKLRDMIKPGDTVYTVLRHVTASGMRRSIDAYIIRNNEPVWLSYWAGKAIGYKADNKRGGLILNGCGTDMGFELHVPEEHRLPMLTTVVIPDGVDDLEIRSRLLNDYDIEIGGGLGQLAGKVWRIGLMGYSSRRKNVVNLLGALRELMPDL